MKRIKKLLVQFCKFGLVGTLCFFIDYGVMVLLTETSGLGYFLSSAISFTLSVVVNYILSMRFVFKGKDDLNKVQEMAIFVALSMVGLEPDDHVDCGGIFPCVLCCSEDFLNDAGYGVQLYFPEIIP